MDWLQSTGDMNIHRCLKRLAFTHQGKGVCLQGIAPNTASCQEISVQQLEGLDHVNSIYHLVHLSEVKEVVEQEPCPPEFATLLEEFASLFLEPQGLPPRREFDHKITLLPGSRPVNLRPYRYNPEQKNEIERQITEMLKQGIICFSTSPEGWHLAVLLGLPLSECDYIEESLPSASY
jgi:hypothetical protein